VRYVLATTKVPDQERQYYAGPVRKIAGRMAHKVAHVLEHATGFDTVEEAEAMCKELGAGYDIVAAED
jgi:hypothetical protein